MKVDAKRPTYIKGVVKASQHKASTLSFTNHLFIHTSAFIILGQRGTSVLFVKKEPAIAWCEDRRKKKHMTGVHRPYFSNSFSEKMARHFGSFFHTEAHVAPVHPAHTTYIHIYIYPSTISPPNPPRAAARWCGRRRVEQKGGDVLDHRTLHTTGKPVYVWYRVVWWWCYEPISSLQPSPDRSRPVT